MGGMKKMVEVHPKMGLESIHTLILFLHKEYLAV